MSNLTYFINTGRPGDIASGTSGATLKQSLAAFGAYRDESEKIGNTWEAATLEVIYDNGDTRLYGFGQRGGVNRID